MTKTIDQLEDAAQRNEGQQVRSGAVTVCHCGMGFDYYDNSRGSMPMIDREEAIALLAADAYDRQGMPDTLTVPPSTHRVPDRVDVWFIENQRAQIREYCLPPHMLEQAKPITATEIALRSAEWKSRTDKALTWAVNHVETERGMRRFHARYLIQPSWLAAKIAVQWWHDEDGDETGRGWQGDFLDTIGM